MPRNEAIWLLVGVGTGAACEYTARRLVKRFSPCQTRRYAYWRIVAAVDPALTAWMFGYLWFGVGVRDIGKIATLLAIWGAVAVPGVVHLSLGHKFQQ